MAGFEQEKAPLVFLLSEADYALLRITIMQAGGENAGQIELAIPATCMEKFAATDQQFSGPQESERWCDFMTDVAATAPIELTAVVQKMDVSLGRILELKKASYWTFPAAR